MEQTPSSFASQVPTRWNTWNIISPEEFLPHNIHARYPRTQWTLPRTAAAQVPSPPSPPSGLETHSQPVVGPDPLLGPSIFSLPSEPSFRARLGGNSSPSENRAAAHKCRRQSLEPPIHTWPHPHHRDAASWPHTSLAHTHTHNPAMTTTGYRCMMLPRRYIFWSGINRYCRLLLGRRPTLAHPFPIRLCFDRPPASRSAPCASRLSFCPSSNRAKGTTSGAGRVGPGWAALEAAKQCSRL